MNIVLVGPLASGKTAIADKLIEKEIANFSDYYSVEMARREHSDGTYAGERHCLQEKRQLVRSRLGRSR